MHKQERRRIGRDVLAPPFTRYDVRVTYEVFDVTGALRAGKNAVGVILGTGWYNAHTNSAWLFQHAPWRDRPKMICQLHVRLADGSEQVICSDPRGRAQPGR